MESKLYFFYFIFLFVNYAETTLSSDDPNLVEQQKLLLDLYANNRKLENSVEFLFTFIDQYTRQDIRNDFLQAIIHNRFLQKDDIFSMANPKTRRYTKNLFDLFYFAKNFDIFYKAANWARNHINYNQFVFAYTLAILHRKDCQLFSIPPFYEILPTYFVPTDTIHHLYQTKMLDITEKKFHYNNTGDENNYQNMFDDPLSLDDDSAVNYKINYLTEDVGLNNFYTLYSLNFPSWMCPIRYGENKWFKRGESFYFIHQQILARYNLERIANDLPFVERLEWDLPIKIGYNPRVSHPNGISLLTRPDKLIAKTFNKMGISRVEQLEERVLGVIDSMSVWDIKNTTLLSLNSDEGIEQIGKIIYGTTERPNRKYFRSYFWEVMDTIGFLIHTADHQLIGEALSTPLTTLRDPLFYRFLNRLISLFQRHLKNFLPYKREELKFPDVRISNFEVSKLETYFDRFEYEITNNVPLKKSEYKFDYKYLAEQKRLNHRPFTYNIYVFSKNPEEAIVRIFIGPKHDPLGRVLTLEQSRLKFMEVDRFYMKLTPGENKFERHCTDSPYFTPDPDSYRLLYTKVNNSINQSKPFLTNKRPMIGIPNRLQLPKGATDGKVFLIAVVITPYKQQYNDNPKKLHAIFNDIKLWDDKNLGFPFDRRIEVDYFTLLDNFLIKDIKIFHN